MTKITLRVASLLTLFTACAATRRQGWVHRQNGKTCHQPQYDSLSEFSEGLSVACVGQCDRNIGKATVI